MKWASLLLALVGTQPFSSPQPNLASWYMIYADRSGLMAISSDVKKEGLSGSFTTMLFVNPEPTPGKPNVVDDKVEFDCFSKRIRFDGGIVSNFGSAARHDNTGSDWERPPAGSNLEAEVNFGCKGIIPTQWTNTHMAIDALISFYYEKILGEPEPK